jgi:Ca-activated chloride channel family protein
MTDKFRTARLAPSELFKRLNPDDEAFLITVGDRAELKQGFTSDFSEIENGLLFTNTTGTTSLLDGIFMGLNELRKAHNPRKALVVVSDGGDNSSRYNMREIMNMAVESDAQIFAIGLFDNPKTREELDGPALLSDITAKTGGVAYGIKNVAQMGSVMAKIGITLHNQYVLGFYPTDTSKDGKYRKIDVSLVVPPALHELRIFARSGYYAPTR